MKMNPCKPETIEPELMELELNKPLLTNKELINWLIKSKLGMTEAQLKQIEKFGLTKTEQAKHKSCMFESGLIESKPEMNDNASEIIKNAPKMNENEPDIIENVPEMNENEPDIIENAPEMNENEPETTPKMNENEQGLPGPRGLNPYRDQFVSTLTVSGEEFDDDPRHLRAQFDITIYQQGRLTLTLEHSRQKVQKAL